MGFSEHRILTENLYLFKGNGAKKLIKEFLSKGWRLWVPKKLSKNLQQTGMTARQSGSIESIQNISRFSIL